MAEAPLAVAVPLMAALLSIPLGRRAGWLLAATVPAGLVLAWRLSVDAPAAHAVGGWQAPLGIMMRSDGLAAAFVALAALVTSAAGLFAVRYLSDTPDRRRGFFWSLLHLVWAACNAIFLSRDLFNIYVGLELLTLGAIGLAALDGRAVTVAAAMRYMLFALAGSACFLIGTALIYGAAGMLDIALLREVLQQEPPTLLGAALLTAGLFAKTALFPLHAWLPPAHSHALAPASALLSALVVTASFYVLFRLWFDLLAPLATDPVVLVLGMLGAAAVFYGGAVALRQKRLKSIIAYSTVAQMGYLLLVFPLAGGSGAAQPWTASAWSGAALHALAHGLAKAAMFLAAGAMILSAGSDRLSALAGVGRSVPVASFAFALAAVSLMGLPPSGGFLAKYLMLTASFAGGQWWWGAVLVTAGLLTAAYLFRPLAELIRVRPAGAAPLGGVHWTLQLMPLLLALGSIAMGIASMPLYRLIQLGHPISAEAGLP